MADLRITELPALAGADAETTDLVPVADLSASETRKLTLGDLAGEVGKLLPNGSLPATKLAADSITSAQIAAGAITSSELADNSVASKHLSTGAVTGAAGAKAIIAAGSIGTADLADASVTTAKLAALAVTNDKITSVDGSKITGDIALTALPDTTAAGQVLAGPTGGAGAVTARALTSTDLPVATTAARGAVQVNGNGLRLAGDTIALDHTIAANTTPSLVAYDQYGRVTAAAGITPSALPIATNTAIGGVSVPLTSGLAVDGAGALTHGSTVAAGTGTKVTFNATGHITGVGTLAATDIPSLDASKITSGTLDTGRIGNGTITQQKLADYSISYIQEAAPPAILGSQHIGTLWFQESTARLSMWNGNSWMAVGQGSLSAENLRFCGLFAATTGQITAVTTFGTAAGLVVSTTIPVATNQLTGVYLVCQVPGTYSGAAYDAGDWILCMGQARGWERIDTLNGGGGGGGGTLDGLTDVTITTPATGDVLVYNGSTWVNGALPDPGTY